MLSVFESERKFVVFSHGASYPHGPLLLRSGKTDQHHTRIDVLITDVRAMEIRSWFNGLEILEVDQEYLREFRSNPIEMIQPGLRVYALQGVGWREFIVGGALFVHEDELEFMDPSGFAVAGGTGEPQMKGGILAALRRSPLLGADLNLARSHETGRTTDL